MKNNANGDAPLENLVSGDAPLKNFANGGAPLKIFVNGNAPLKNHANGDAPMKNFVNGDAPMKIRIISPPVTSRKPSESLSDENLIKMDFSDEKLRSHRSTEGGCGRKSIL